MCRFFLQDTMQTIFKCSSFQICVVLNTPLTLPRDFCRNLNLCIPSATSSSSSTSSKSVISERRATSSSVNQGSARSSQVFETDEVITVVQLTDIHVEQEYAIVSRSCTPSCTALGLGCWWYYSYLYFLYRACSKHIDKPSESGGVNSHPSVFLE